MSALGLLNFVALQWFGVRLARVTCSQCRCTVLTMREIDCLFHPRWRVLRWVWPLTGWWSRYRWIARRP